jgi:hypothetical protein
LLKTARLGLEDLQGSDPRRRMPGLRSVVVFGVATTQALHKLRGAIGKPTYDAWYTPFKEEMENDPLLKYFWALRTQISHEGNMGTISNRIYVNTTEGRIERIERLRPPDAVPFILDEFGGSGWMTRLPDGTLERYYVDLPSDTNYETPTFHVGEPPATHLGKTLADTSVNALATLYVAYLSHVFSAAYQRFS